jgi:hypothetical protein
MKPNSKAIKRLCTLSGNRCAFYGCLVKLVEDDSEFVAGEICHIRASRKGGPRYDPRQSEEDRHSFSNLLLLCATHHTIIDSDVTKYTVEYLEEMKRSHNPTGNIEVQAIDVSRAERLLKKYDFQVSGHLTIGNITVENVTFKRAGPSRVKVALPERVVGGSPIHRRYASHLISRYKEVAGNQPERTFKHAVIYKTIEREFGATWEWVGIDQFERIVLFLYFFRKGPTRPCWGSSTRAEVVRTILHFRCIA